MIYKYTDYTFYLRDELIERQSRNPGYSLRAMARDFAMSPSQLSSVLKGQKGISPTTALRICSKLGLTAQEADFFQLLVQLRQTENAALKEQILGKLKAIHPEMHIRELSVDHFRMIADWYHFAILEMTQLKGFKLSAKTASRRLGITQIEAESAIKRLLRLELIEPDDERGYRKTEENLLVSSAAPNEALRHFHRSMLQKASDALETQSPEERYVGSQTFSIDVDQLDQAREILARCRRELVELFDQGKKRTETYHLGIQLFRLTQPESKTLKKEKQS